MSAVVKQPYPVVLPIAERLVEALRPWCDRIEIAGSLRRERPQVGDIEIVAIPRRLKDLFGHPIGGLTMLDSFLDDRGVTFAKRGERYQQFVYGRFTVDLFLPTAETWGSVFAIRTGGWEFSRWLVTSVAAGGAAPEGVVFRDGRLLAHGRLLATPEEADVFAALGLAWVPPMERTGPVAEPLRIEPVWNFA
jgi:DNA polymerase/3'-5' exonuclease PolX